MSQPSRHHYVPKTYLKQFADNQQCFFQLNKGTGYISKKNISQVCYLPNYHTIKKEETKTIHNIKDENEIEKRGFVKYENNYGIILTKIIRDTNGVLSLPTEDMLLFLEILVSIKRRNPFYKKRIMEKTREYYGTEKMLQDFRPFAALSNQVDPNTDAEAYIKQYMHYVKTDEDKQSDMYVSRLPADKNDITANVAKTLSQYKVFLIVASAGFTFITSDNPGFMQAGGELMHVGGLRGDFLFIFPLTPTHCLAIQSDQPDPIPSPVKSVYSITIESRYVQEINKATLQLANAGVFALDKQILTELSL